MTGFSGSEVTAEFKACIRQFEALARGHTVLSGIIENTHTALKEFDNRGYLRLAFVGEYGAGKSTIVSALTGRRDIEISSDIMTSRTQDFDWNGIKIMDTPGLFTERLDHDAITYEAIRKSDLIAFCLTHGLFDDITVENFKHLAFDEGYQSKMILVVNKMSAEASTGEDQKILNYRKSLADALLPHDLNNFPLCFIDAEDFIEGTDTENPGLIRLSRFETFVTALDGFVKINRLLAQLDTPVRILQGKLNEASVSLARNDAQDETFLELLERLAKATERERARLRVRCRGITLEISAKVLEEGSTLANAVGQDQEFEASCKSALIRIQGHAEVGTERMKKEVEESCSALQTEVEQVLNSSLAQVFLSQPDTPARVKAGPALTSDSVARFKKQTAGLTKIAQTVGLELSKQALKDGAGVVGKAGLFLKSGQVAGSNLHQAILATGKLFGAKFTPWQAVNLAKNVGNLMKVVGPVLVILSIIIDIADEFQQAENEQKVSEARRQVDSEFKLIADEIVKQFEIQLQSVEAELFDHLAGEITAAIREEEASIAGANEGVKALVAIRTRTEALLERISGLPRV